MTADVHRAAHLLDTGLNSFAAFMTGTGRRRDTPATADATEHA